MCRCTLGTEIYIPSGVDEIFLLLSRLVWIATIAVVLDRSAIVSVGILIEAADLIRISPDIAWSIVRGLPNCHRPNISCQYWAVSNARLTGPRCCRPACRRELRIGPSGYLIDVGPPSPLCVSMLPVIPAIVMRRNRCRS